MEILAICWVVSILGALAGAITMFQGLSNKEKLDQFRVQNAGRSP
jgi:hypothetical protein